MGNKWRARPQPPFCFVFFLFFLLTITDIHGEEEEEEEETKGARLLWKFICYDVKLQHYTPRGKKGRRGQKPRTRKGKGYTFHGKEGKGSPLRGPPRGEGRCGDGRERERDERKPLVD